MRSHEFVTDEINKQVFSPGWTDETTILNRYVLKAQATDDWNKYQKLDIEVFDPESGIPFRIAHARFRIKPGFFFQKNLEASMIYVSQEYQKRGIATAIYQYVRKLGNTIKPSRFQLPAGKSMWKSFDRTDALAESDEPTRIKLGSSDSAAAEAWIDRVYKLYPQTFQNNHVMPLGGSGDDQEFAMFELVPSLSRRGAVEVKWFQAYPLRQGVGSRAMQQLQQLAREDGISLTLFPWDKGQVSQSKLTKFYRGQGFAPAQKGSKAMQWTPDQQGVAESAGIQPRAAGCVIVAADTGRWCLQQRSNSVSDPGVWSTWGGRREPGENLQQCVRRELAEESGYQGPVRLEPVDSNSMYATFLAHVPYEFEPELDSASQDYQWCHPEDLPQPLHPGLQQTLGQLMESAAQYHEIEFVCANPDFCEATDPAAQRELSQALQQIPGVTVVYQDQSDYSAGQFSLAAIYSDTSARQRIIKLARQHGVAVDIERPVDDDYVDRAVRGELEGQIQENFADGKKPGRKGLSKRVGIPKKATLSQLQKIASSSTGERRRMAQWQLNMRRGKAKKNK
jgi:8-oxo-dGTP pyrophosphatase MutT (NUDIX family)/GNAT superfamily N-acetyltransferase